MSISKELRNDIYFTHKKNPYIKRSVLVKEFGVSHKTVTKAINDMRILDMEAVAKIGISFYAELLKFQDQYRGDIVNAVVQSDSYKKSKHDSTEFQEFMEMKLKEFNEQKDIFRKYAIEKNEKENMNEVEWEEAFEQKLAPNLKALNLYDEFLSTKEIMSTFRDVYADKIDAHIEDKRLEIKRAAIKEWEALKKPQST